jgi:tRNA(fMet)-specific endonuclease VapC
MPVVVDTDVLSFQIKGDSRARRYDRFLTGQLWVISFMTLAELRWWTLQRRWGAARRRQLTEHLRQVHVYYADSDLCDWWARVTLQTRRNGHPLDSADAWIAATALAIDVPLVTNNSDDFSAVEGLTVMTAQGHST